MSSIADLNGGAKPAVAMYPPSGANTFKGSLMNCFASGCCACCCKMMYMYYCPCLFYGGLMSKAGEPWLAGCCAPFMGLGMLRTSVRRHYGIATEGCPDVGCGSDCMTTCCCTSCAALQLDLTLDDMAAKGVSMANSGIPKS